MEGVDLDLRRFGWRQEWNRGPQVRATGWRQDEEVRGTVKKALNTPSVFRTGHAVRNETIRTNRWPEVNGGCRRFPPLHKSRGSLERSPRRRPYREYSSRMLHMRPLRPSMQGGLHTCCRGIPPEARQDVRLRGGTVMTLRHRKESEPEANRRIREVLRHLSKICSCWRVCA